MKKFVSAIAVTLLGASLALAAPQEHGDGGHGRQMASFNERYAQPLSLTDAQKAKIDAIQKDTREKNAAFFEESHKTMKELSDAKQANDTAKIDALKPTIDAQRAKMKEIRGAEDAQIATVLTADQNEKWQKLKAEHAAERGQHQQ
jgi:Spy/CpxP family protein refolding chaperone